MATSERLVVFRPEPDGHTGDIELATSDFLALYSHDSGRRSSIAKCSKTPALPVVLIGAEESIADMAIAGNFVYWSIRGASDAASGEIWRAQWQ
jgi:hypothetical protein